MKLTTEKADVKSWKPTGEVGLRKLVQARGMCCLECTRIVNLWVKNFGYAPQRFLVQEDVRENVHGGRVVGVGKGRFWEASAAGA